MQGENQSSDHQSDSYLALNQQIRTTLASLLEARPTGNLREDLVLQAKCLKDLKEVGSFLLSDDGARWGTFFASLVRLHKHHFAQVRTGYLELLVSATRLQQGRFLLSVISCLLELLKDPEPRVVKRTVSVCTVLLPEALQWVCRLDDPAEQLKSWALLTQLRESVQKLPLRREGPSHNSVGTVALKFMQTSILLFTSTSLSDRAEGYGWSLEDIPQHHAAVNAQALAREANRLLQLLLDSLAFALTGSGGAGSLAGEDLEMIYLAESSMNAQVCVHLLAEIAVKRAPLLLQRILPVLFNVIQHTRQHIYPPQQMGRLTYAIEIALRRLISTFHESVTLRDSQNMSLGEQREQIRRAQGLWEPWKKSLADTLALVREEQKKLRPRSVRGSYAESMQRRVSRQLSEASGLMGGRGRMERAHKRLRPGQTLGSTGRPTSDPLLDPEVQRLLQEIREAPQPSGTAAIAEMVLERLGYFNPVMLRQLHQIPSGGGAAPEEEVSQAFVRYLSIFQQLAEGKEVSVLLEQQAKTEEPSPAAAPQPVIVAPRTVPPTPIPVLTTAQCHQMIVLAFERLLSGEVERPVHQVGQGPLRAGLIVKLVTTFLPQQLRDAGDLQRRQLQRVVDALFQEEQPVAAGENGNSEPTTSAGAADGVDTAMQDDQDQKIAPAEKEEEGELEEMEDSQSEGEIEETSSGSEDDGEYLQPVRDGFLQQDSPPEEDTEAEALNLEKLLLSHVASNFTEERQELALRWLHAVYWMDRSSLGLRRPQEDQSEISKPAETEAANQRELPNPAEVDWLKLGCLELGSRDSEGLAAENQIWRYRQVLSQLLLGLQDTLVAGDMQSFSHFLRQVPVLEDRKDALSREALLKENEFRRALQEGRVPRVGGKTVQELVRRILRHRKRFRGKAGEGQEGRKLRRLQSRLYRELQPPLRSAFGAIREACWSDSRPRVTLGLAVLRDLLLLRFPGSSLQHQRARRHCLQQLVQFASVSCVSHVQEEAAPGGGEESGSVLTTPGAGVDLGGLDWLRLQSIRLIGNVLLPLSPEIAAMVSQAAIQLLEQLRLSSGALGRLMQGYEELPTPEPLAADPVPSLPVLPAGQARAPEELQEQRKALEKQLLARKLRVQEHQMAQVRAKRREVERQDQIVRHFLLFFALCSRRHELLPHLFQVYADTSPVVRVCLHKEAPQLIQTLGPLNKVLHSTLRNCETEALPLALHFIQELAGPGTDSGEDARTPANVVPHPHITELARWMYYQRSQDARFLIPVLPGLGRDAARNLLPKLVALPAPSLKQGMEKLLSSHPPLLSPVEIIVLLHHIDVGLFKQVVEATQICFQKPNLFTAQVMAIALQQLIEQNPVPSLFMWTLIQTLVVYPQHTAFACSEILPRLLGKRVWENNLLWEGFIRCLQQIGAGSAHQPSCGSVLFQLPPDRLTEILDKAPDLAPVLQEYLTVYPRHAQQFQKDAVKAVRKEQPEGDSAAAGPEPGPMRDDQEAIPA